VSPRSRADLGGHGRGGGAGRTPRRGSPTVCCSRPSISTLSVPARRLGAPKMPLGMSSRARTGLIFPSGVASEPCLMIERRGFVRRRIAQLEAWKRQSRRA
jgi:hypothetical protein